MKNSLIALILIRYKEYIREPGIVFWSLIFPILMAWVLGVAFTKRTELVQTIALVEYEKNTTIEEFLNYSTNYSDTINKKNYYKKTINYQQLGKVTYKIIPVEWDEAILMVKQGKTSLILSSYNDSINFHFDPASQDNKLTYLLLSSALNRNKLDLSTSDIKILRKKGTRYIDYLLPGLIGMGIMNSVLWGISYALIDMRSRKLLRRMIATPMKKSYFFISHFAARITLSSVEAALLIGFAMLYFKLEIQGSILAFLLMFIAGNICFSGIAILISSKTSNSRIGTGLINILTMPMTILSGIFFSYHNFPDGVVKFVQKLPLTILADNLRAVFVEGVGISQIFTGFIVLISSGLLLAYIGLRIYKWY